MNTNWSKPSRNIFAGIMSLRSALAAGQNAKLIRARNEDCAFPIREKKHDTDFRNYEFRIGYLSTRNEILGDSNTDDFHKHLTLNYKTCYGSKAAADRYYESGCLSPDNFKGMGTSHLVSIEDLITYYKVIGNLELAELYRSQYCDDGTADDRHFFDFFRYKSSSEFAPKYFRKRLWVVVLLGDNSPKVGIPWYIRVLNAVMLPLKYVPKKTVLKMDNYKVITYRVGAVVNGFSVDIHIPKKFGFN